MGKAGESGDLLAVSRVHIGCHTGQDGGFVGVFLGFVQSGCELFIFHKADTAAVFVHLADDIAQRQSVVIDSVEDAASLRCFGELEESVRRTVDRTHADLIFDHLIGEAPEQAVAAQSAHEVIGQEIDLKFAVRFTGSERSHTDDFGIQSVCGGLQDIAFAHEL